MKIPNGWKKVQFGDVVNKINDKVSNRDEWTFDRFIGGQHFDEGEIRVTRSAPIEGNEEVIGPAFNMRFKPEQVLYVTRNPRLRKGGMVDFEGVCSNVSFVMETKSEQLLQSLLPFVIQTEDFVKHTCNNAHGSTNPFLNWKDIAKYEFLLPPIDEQKKINEILWALEENIKLLQIIQKQRMHISERLLNKLIKEGIKPNKIQKTKFGEISIDHQIYTIQELLDNKSILSHLDGNHGGLYPKADEFISSGIKYLSATMIIDGKMDLSLSKYLSEERAKKFTKGVSRNEDVLLAHNAVVGPSAILKTNEEYVILGTSLTYFRCDSKKICNRYLLYYFRSKIFQNQLDSVMKQSTRNQVPITTQRKLSIILPKIEQQVKIADILDKIYNNHYSIKRSILSLKGLRNKLSNELLKGELRLD